MTSFRFANCSAEDLWKYVASTLAKNDVDVVLVGGAVVSIYTEGAFVSGDLDFVLYDFSRTRLQSLLDQLGFKKRGGRHFVHPKCPHLYLEFMTFPASIGDDYSIIPDEVDFDGVKIKIYSPTDSVRDRLSSYIHFKAKDCLDQAVMVAKRHPINFGKVQKWCTSEGSPQSYEDFLKKLKG